MIKIGDEFNPHNFYKSTPRSIRKFKGLTPCAKWVWEILFDLAGESGICEASQTKMAKELGMHELSISGALNSLEKQGFIKKHDPKNRRKNDSFSYTFLYHECLDPENLITVHCKDKNGNSILKQMTQEEIDRSQSPKGPLGKDPLGRLIDININTNTNIQDNNSIENSFAKAKLRGDSSNPPQSESSSCGTIKLNRRIQKHLSDNQVPPNPTSQESLLDVQSLPAKEPIRQVNVPATTSTPSPKTKAQIIREKSKEQRENQKQPELFIPDKVKEIINFWENQEIKGKKLYIAKKEFYETKQKGIKAIQDLLRSYTPDQINIAIHRFSLATLDDDYYPVDKTKTERLTLLGFLFGKYKDRKTGMLVSNGYFKQYMEEPPKLITQLKPDTHKEITIRLQNRYATEISGGLELKQLSPAQKIERQNMFIEASEEIYNFCTKNKDRLNYMPKADMADLLFDAVLSVAGNKATSFTIGRLKSNVTLTQVLPAFAFSKGYANDLVPQDIRPISDYYDDQPPTPQDYDPDADRDIFDEEDAIQEELTEAQKAERKAAQIAQEKAEAAFEERCKNRGAALKAMPATTPNGFRQRHGMLYDGPEDD